VAPGYVSAQLILTAHGPFEVKQPLMLVSSAANYLELLKVLLNNGTGTNGAQILKPETVKQM